MKALLATLLLIGPALHAQQAAVLPPADVEKLMPATVFFQGQSAPIQVRNAAGVRFTPTAVLLAALVDTSGYSTAVQARYQAYLIAETAISIDGHALPAGAYGVGFLPNDQFVVMDIGGHDLFLAHSTQDPEMRRPRPLQIVPAPGAFRLYEGRAFVPITQAAASR